MSKGVESHIGKEGGITVKPDQPSVYVMRTTERFVPISYVIMQRIDVHTARCEDNYYSAKGHT